MKDLNNDNYYENNEYMSASQFKDFKSCEARALAKYKGEWQDKPTDALLIGSYVDAYFSGELEKFKFEHPEICLKNGELKAQFKQADKIIERIKNDDYTMSLINGDKQVILIGEINDVPFKIKMDYEHPDMIVDGKVMKDCNDIWIKGEGYIPFWKVYGYDTQMSIYQNIVAQNRGVLKECKLQVATKEEATDLRVFKFSQETLNAALEEVKNLAPRFHQIKQGFIKPIGCGTCEYCRSQKKLNIESEELI